MRGRILLTLLCATCARPDAPGTLETSVRADPSQRPHDFPDRLPRDGAIEVEPWTVDRGPREGRPGDVRVRSCRLRGSDPALGALARALPRGFRQVLRVEAVRPEPVTLAVMDARTGRVLVEAPALAGAPSADLLIAWWLEPSPGGRPVLAVALYRIAPTELDLLAAAWTRDDDDRIGLDSFGSGPDVASWDAVLGGGDANVVCAAWSRNGAGTEDLAADLFELGYAHSNLSGYGDLADPRLPDLPIESWPRPVWIRVLTRHGRATAPDEAAAGSAPR